MSECEFFFFFLCCGTNVNEFCLFWAFTFLIHYAHLLFVPYSADIFSVLSSLCNLDPMLSYRIK